MNNYRDENKTVEKKTVQKVVDGDVKVRKKSGASKVADIFISEDASKVKDYIFMDVLVPAMKKALSDIVVNGIDMILYGETNRSRRESSPTNTIRYTNYNSISNGRDSYRSGVTRSTYSYDELTYTNKGSAEAVLMGLDDIIRRYNFATVGDLYELSGRPTVHTDYKYGWTDLRSADVVRYRNGEYGLKLPRAMTIDD